MNSLQIFNNGEFPIRTIQYGGGLWFVAKDVAEALEYSEASINQVNNLCATVPEIWKGHKRIMTPGGEQEMLCLTEQGLYFFLGRSDKKKALPYQMWIAGDVVPSIRRTGSYSVHKEQTALPAGVLEGAKLIFEVAGIKDSQLALAMDKIYRSYTGHSALTTGEIQLEAQAKQQALTPSEIAEHLGLGHGRKGARIINALLANANYQRKIAGKYWEPTTSGLNTASCSTQIKDTRTERQSNKLNGSLVSAVSLKNS